MLKLSPGVRLGNYTIVSFIGEGGMGSVYLATEDVTQRRVAIKALKNGPADDPTFRQRFINEARIQAKLNHPNIVHLYNFIQEGAEFYMVMEYCEGSTLRELIQRRGKLDAGQARLILTAILKGLTHAHSLGVIHRDIKPSNVMFTADNEVKITDFGIARLTGDVHFTSSGQAIGTPMYMSPEQVTSPMQVDYRSDIYSAGVVFFEMLCGRLPFDVKTQVQFHIEHAIVNDPLPPTTDFPWVSNADWNILRMMLDKVPGRRPDISSVIALLDSRPAQNHEPRPSYRPNPTPPPMEETITGPGYRQPPYQSQPAPEKIVEIQNRSPRKYVPVIVLLALIIAGLGGYIAFSGNGFGNRDGGGPTDPPSPVENSSITITANNVCLRAEPGKNARVLARLDTGNVVQFSGEKTSWKDSFEIKKKVRNEPWLKVTNKQGITGWVFGGATSLADGSDDPGVAPASQSVPTPAPPEVDSGYNSRVAVYVSKLRLHNSPGESAPIIGKVDEGDILFLTGRITNWNDTIELRGTRYTMPWIEVTTRGGVTGWVFGGATSFRDQW